MASAAPAPSPLQAAVLGLCDKYPDGLPSTVIEKELGGQFDLMAIMTELNNFLAEGKFKLLKGRDNTPYYQRVSDDIFEKTKSLTQEESIIYSLIQSTGNMGMWVREIRRKSQLQPKQVEKLLKTLESRKLVKAVKCVAVKNKKVYMLFDVEPSKTLTGGAWYNDQEFDKEFIQVLQQQCHKFLEKKGYATLEQISQQVKDSSISKVELLEEDVLSIVQALIFDGKVEEVQDAGFMGGAPLYKPILTSDPRAFNTYTDIPCSACPVFSECSDEGDVNPRSCVYYQTWLDQF